MTPWGCKNMRHTSSWARHQTCGKSNLSAWGPPAALGTQAWVPFPTPVQSLVSEFLLHLSTRVLGFRAALNGGAGCALHNSREHHS